jgi:hypothetical protein
MYGTGAEKVDRSCGVAAWENFQTIVIVLFEV